MKKIFLASILLMPVFLFASIDTNLKYGLKGDKVSELQTFLISKGFLQSKVTGFFGNMTLQAVKDYQASVDVEQTGYVGPLTRAKINGGENVASSGENNQPSSVDQLAAVLRRVSINMKLSTSTIPSGSGTTISWTTRYAEGCWATGDWSGQKPTSGRESSGPLTSSKTYILTCTGSSGSATVSRTVTVITPTATNPNPLPVPTATLTATPTNITSGSSSTLSWNTSNASSVSINQSIGTVAVSGSISVSPIATTTYTLTASNSSGTVTSSVTVSVGPVIVMDPMPMPPPPPPSTSTSTIPSTVTIWGPVDSVTLGTCSAQVHDKYIVSGGDGFYYRIWHPQVDSSGCIFAHEHGMNPDSMTDSWVRNNWDQRFGYASRRMPMPDEPNGHVEAHEGYKVFVANIGDRNDEGRINKTASLSTVHMGTGGPKRFSVQHHSNSIAYKQDNIYAATHLLLDTGGVAGVCDPRAQAPTKDGLVLGTCRVNSPYEIWSMTQTIKSGSREIYRGFATPAVFDPITAFNPANPAELVYAWDPRIDTIKNFNNDWSGHRGCDRESYAQLGYFYNGNGPTEYWTDPMGNVVSQTAPNAIKQIVAQSNVGGNPPFSSDIAQFKMRAPQCANRSNLGLKN